MEELKEDLRKRLLKKRQAFADKKTAQRLILSNIRSLHEYNRASSVMLYSPIKGEPDIRELFYELTAKGVKVAFPRVEGKDIVAVEIEDLSQLKPGKFNILEPQKGKIISPKELDLIFVPGIAFDRRGYRLGFGKGYYDRFLKNTKGVKVGVAFHFQIVNSLPNDPWDVPVDIVITDREVIRR